MGETEWKKIKKNIKTQQQINKDCFSIYTNHMENLGGEIKDMQLTAVRERQKDAATRDYEVHFVFLESRRQSRKEHLKFIQNSSKPTCMPSCTISKVDLSSFVLWYIHTYFRLNFSKLEIAKRTLKLSLQRCKTSYWISLSGQMDATESRGKFFIGKHYDNSGAIHRWKVQVTQMHKGFCMKLFILELTYLNITSTIINVLASVSTGDTRSLCTNGEEQ